jgi:hypothetical protein
VLDMCEPPDGGAAADDESPPHASAPLLKRLHRVGVRAAAAC